MVNPVIFRATGGTLNWETNAGHPVVRSMFKKLKFAYHEDTTAIAKWKSVLPCS
jgi:hypothetical protein